MVRNEFFFYFSPLKLSLHTYIRIRFKAFHFVSFYDHWCPLVVRKVSISGILSSRPYLHFTFAAPRHRAALHATLTYPG